MPTLYTVTTWKEDLLYAENPTEIFHKICAEKKNTLLLESSETSTKKKTTSTIIVDSALRITAVRNRLKIRALSKNGVSLLKQLDSVVPSNVVLKTTEYLRIMQFSLNTAHIEEDKRLLYPSVFDCFRWLKQVVRAAHGSMKSLFCGGLLSYDLIHSFEYIPHMNECAPCPDLCFYLAESMVSFDHDKKNTQIQVHVFTCDHRERRRLHTRMQQLHHILKKNRPASSIDLKVPISSEKTRVKSNMSDSTYAKTIDRMHEFIKKGEVFQVVPSRQFYCTCAHPFSAYVVLKHMNPSPYMFFMQDTQFTLFGASPESYLQYNPDSRIVQLNPIAGTRPRGLDADGNIDLDLDNRLELSLRTHPKELSEHLMLVDLARNDLAKVCRTGSRFVSRLMDVEKYSHVMHLVSSVTGVLRDNLDVFHAYQSCMNMGTLTGAPKLRAMQLIAQHENVNRGAYGGSVGYFTGSGSFDACIVIRSAFVKKNIATVQSGVGIVYDSITHEEIEEGKNKASAVLQSICNTHRIDVGE
ncbi:anthranilate synthase component 1 [Buchnera aphidicola]|uniref:Anthranilate synthase component 1 n=1 Tax=Buchnera aphidicola (Cinara cf. splendens/pseudotsugae 3390) TaxID=2518980 RepID=A0A451D1F8_9GAMM|nr:anthranilate synthase component 1 [Buchnera aphidicola]VFP79412.1 Anthranilate synthase component 1 [Buchnera aphidicola (Cinara cf. splendens/pseudotsugae 3390)]